MDAGAGPLLCAEHILNPMTGRYTVTEDLSAVAPLVVALANRYADYERDGATAWDRTGECAYVCANALRHCLT